METNFQDALKNWQELGQQVTYLGIKHCPTKFQIYWNGAISCFVGKSCFGKVFPTQKHLAEKYEQDQLHLTFGFGEIPIFHIEDRNQVSQSLLNGYLPIITTTWDSDGIRYEITTFATQFHPTRKETVPEQTLCMNRITVKNISDTPKESVHLWMNFSGYKCLIWEKEKPEDSFPEYGRNLLFEENQIMDDQNRIRAILNSTSMNQYKFHKKYEIHDTENPMLDIYKQKGLLRNLLHIRIPLGREQERTIEFALPYFPIDSKNAIWLKRDFNHELRNVLGTWEKEYQKDVQIITPEPLVNNFYKSGLHHILITTDLDLKTGILYAKSSPAWYETIWANLAIATAIALDYRGFHEEATQYLEPFLEWQGVNSPPNMESASSEGFFAPPKEFSEIPWVTNHGWTLWGLVEHYKITKDRNWLNQIIPKIIKGCEWIIRERNRTKMSLSNGENEIGYGLLPAGTVSDDKGSGQYLCNDAHNYRGLRTCADMFLKIGYPDASRWDKEAKEYLSDIQNALQQAMKRTQTVQLENGDTIPYVPNEIHQTKPPEFTPDNFWPYINYVDVGPLHLVDVEILDPNSDIVNGVLQFEEKFTVAKLKEEISVNENWCFSIKYPGEKPAHLLRHGISVIEPFYAPHATAYFWQDNIEIYLEVFYNQLAGAISHKTLTPVENRFGVWNLPWADAEFLKMLRRMLVQEKGKELLLLYAIPRKWLEQGEKIEVKNLPTYFGNISFSIRSDVATNQIFMTLHPPDRTLPERIKIRFRHPLGKPIQQVLINDREWKNFENDKVTIDSFDTKSLDLEILF